MFPYDAASALNHKEIAKNSEKMSKIKPFIERYDCKDVDCPLGKDDWIKFEDNHQKTVLIVLYARKEKKQYIKPTFQNKIQSVKSKLFF